MLIKFEIHSDGSTGARVAQVPEDSDANPNLPNDQKVSAVYTARAGGSSAQPNSDPGTGAPGVHSSSGSGTVFVIGPIVVCGSGPGHTGPGGGPSQPNSDPGTGRSGAQPNTDPGTGKPAGGDRAAAGNKAQAGKLERPRKRPPTRKQ
jgi:hypothetical protein